MKQNKNWKSQTLIAGSIIGAMSGIFAAYLLIQRAEKKNETPRLSAGEGVKLGLGVLGVLKLVADMGGEK